MKCSKNMNCMKMSQYILLADCWGQVEIPEYWAHGHESYSSLKRDHPVQGARRIAKEC